MSGSITTEAMIAVNAPELPKRDYALDPATNIKLMTARAGALKRVLQDKKLAPLVTSYDRDDKSANRARSHFERCHWISLLARYGIIVVGILFLWLSNEQRQVLVPYAIAVQLLLLLIASGMALYLRFRQPLDTWMRERARAETARITFFERMAQQQAKHGDGELPLLPLQLEYFQRYLAEPQLSYFHNRLKRRRSPLAALGTAVLVLTIIWTTMQFALNAALLAGLIQPAVMDGGLAAHVASAVMPSLSPDGARLGIAQSMVGSAFVVLMLSSTMSKLDERNALRYRQTADNLQKIVDLYYPQALAAAALEGDWGRQTVLAYVRLVTEQVGFGAAEWLTLAELNAIYDSRLPARPDMDLGSAVSILQRPVGAS